MLHSYQTSLLALLQPDGNFTVWENGSFKWGSYENLNVALNTVQSVGVSDTGQLQLLDSAGSALWTSPNPALGGERLIVSAPFPSFTSGHSDSFLKIINAAGNFPWYAGYTP